MLLMLNTYCRLHLCIFCQAVRGLACHLHTAWWARIHGDSRVWNVIGWDSLESTERSLVTHTPEILIDSQSATIIPGNYRWNWNSNHGNKVREMMHLELLCSSNACKIRPGFVCWGTLENYPTAPSKYAMINDTNNSNVKNSLYF